MSTLPDFYPNKPESPRFARPLRAAVIGVGYLGRFHAQKYAVLPDVELVAVTDIDPERARQVAAELHVTAVTDYREILSKVDVVSIAVPTHSHFGVAKRCLEAGVHVLVEKPFTMTIEEADALIELAEQRGLVLQVGHLKRFHPAVMALQQSGLLQPPRFIESERLAPFKARSLDIDVVLDLMIHDVDLILHYARSEVVEVQAVGAPVLTSQLDLANARLTFANGCVANVTASRVALAPSRRLQIFQANAYIALDFSSRSLNIWQKGEGSRLVDGLELPVIDAHTPAVDAYDTLAAQTSAFCQAVTWGLPPLVDGRDGRRALDLVMRIRQAIHGWNARP